MSFQDPSLPSDAYPRALPPEQQGMAGWMKAVLLLIILVVVAGGGWLLFSLLRTNPTATSTHLAQVPADGTGFVTVKVSELWDSKALEKLREKIGPQLEVELKDTLGFSISDIERVTVALAERNWNIDAPAFEAEFWIIIHTRIPLDPGRIIRELDNPIEKVAGGKKYYLNDELRPAALHFASDREVWIALPPVLSGLLEGTRTVSKVGPLAESIEIASSDRHPLQASFVLPEKLKRTLRDGPDLPPQLVPFLDLLVANLALDASGNLEVKLRFNSNASARDASDLIRIEMDRIREGAGVFLLEDELFRALRPVIDGVKLTVHGDEVSVVVPRASDVLVVLPEWFAVRPPEGKPAGDPRDQAANNMRELLLAMHSYHDVHTSFPPARYHKGLSWRVALLPFLEQDPLHKQFRLDEPWDSPHNIKLLDQMPPVFTPVSGPPSKKGYTCYQVVTGENLLFHPTRLVRTTFGNIHDGSSNTFLILESSNLVPWTAPQDIAYEPFMKRPMPALGYQRSRQFLAGFGDGVVAWFSNRMDQETLDRLIHPRDGAVVDPDRFRTK